MNKSRCHIELALVRKLQDEKLAHKTCRARLAMEITAYAEIGKSYILFTDDHTALL
jgi:hypothetical protein